MIKAYRIKEWDTEFETSETRKLKKLDWWPKPNKHDDLHFKRMLKEEDSIHLFGAWTLICDVASRSPKHQRGWLIRGGRALTPVDLADITGFPAALFERALEYFSSEKQQWLVEDTFVDPDEYPQQADERLKQLSASFTPPWMLEAAPSPPPPPERPTEQSSTPQISQQPSEAKAHPAASDKKSAGTPAGSPGTPGSSPAEGKGKKEEKGREESAARPPSSALQFEALQKGLFPREYEAKIKHAEEKIRAIKQDPNLWNYRLRPHLAHLVQQFERRGSPDDLTRAKELKRSPDSWEPANLLPDAAAIVEAWQARIAEIERARDGVKGSWSTKASYERELVPA